MEDLSPKIIACATVIEEVLPILPAGMTYQVLDFGLHIAPQKLKQTLQAAIDAAGQEANTVILGYGLCSLAVVGLRASGCTLVVPRVDDCIGIFLGSQQAYQEQARKQPGTYYLTKGWIEVGDTIFDEYNRMVEKYGEAQARHIMSVMLKNYTRLVYIDTGHADQERCTVYTRRMAAQFDLEYEEIPGSDRLVRKMITGPWDDDFIVTAPGQTITYMDFKTPIANSPGKG